MSYRKHFLLLIVLATIPQAVLGALDDVQLRMLQPFDMPLRWDNIVSAPEWVSGVRPVYAGKQKLYGINLTPGETVTVRINRNELLRVLRMDGELGATDLEMYFSTGSGLYEELSAALSADGHGMLSRLRSDKPYLVRVARPRDAAGAMTVALFASRKEPLGELAPYRQVIDLPGDGVQLRRGDRASAQTYATIKPGQPVEIKVRGPARYVLESRFAYPSGESATAQTYRVHAYIDTVPLSTLEFYTTAESAYPVYIDGEGKLSGREQQGYLEIPPGEHILRLDSTATLYARLLLQIGTDYLFPEKNEPPKPAVVARDEKMPYRLSIAGLPDKPDLTPAEKQQFKPSGGATLIPFSPWLLQPEALENASNNSNLPPPQKEYAAQRLLRDNGHSEGGLLAAMLMQESAWHHEDEPAVQVVASEMLGVHSTYRDLLPQQRTDLMPQYFARFISRDLYATGEQGKGNASGEQQLQESLGRISGAYFSAVPQRNKTGSIDGLRYLLPSRQEPSQLRVMVDGSIPVEAEFCVQYDEGEPVHMFMDAAGERPPDEYVPTQADAALEMLSEQFGSEHASTLDGPFAARHAPGKMIHAGVMELPLPAGVREVRVWSIANKPGNFNLALQYRAAGAFSLSETEYLEMAARTGDANRLQAVFSRVLANKSVTETERAAQELANHWLPVIRALRSEQKVFTAAAVAEVPADSAVATQGELNIYRADAVQAGQQGQWMKALESWGELARRAPTTQRDEARLAQAETLMKLGEIFLAEQQLRGLALFADGADIREQAQARLADYFVGNGDTNSLRSMWAALCVNDPDTRNLRHLVAALVDNHEYGMALALGLLVPTAEQPREALLRAAFQLGWWTTYRRLAAAEASPESRALWQGLEAMSRGQNDRARMLFSTAGKLGADWLLSVDNAIALNKRFSAGNGKLADADIDDWQRWHAAHPGPFAWRDESRFVFDHAGGENLYFMDRDSYVQTFRAEAEKPLRMRVMGPVRLRFEARPLHKATDNMPLNGWLNIREAGGMRILPISNNVPASGLSLLGQENFKPGRSINGDFDFGPGLHEITLDAGEIPVLMRVLARRPEMPVPLLPPLDADSLAASIGDGAGSAVCIWKNCSVLLPLEGQGSAVSRDLRNGWYQEQTGQVAPLPKGTLEDQLPGLAPAGEKLQGLDWPEAGLLSQGNIEGALALHPGKNEADAVRRMLLLLWWSEQNPDKHPQALIEGELLGAQYPQDAALQSMLSRLSRDALWQLAPGVQDSAGQRFFEISGWQPESPALRARKALMPQFGADDQVVSGNGRLLFSLRNLRKSQVMLQLERIELPYLAPMPLKVFYQMDNDAAKRIQLSGSMDRHTLRLNVPAGKHVLRIGLEEPLSEQFLRVRLAGQGAHVPLTMAERPYHVVTESQPLRVAVAGPAWIRIEEMQDGRVETRYKFVSADFEELTLAPVAGRRESLFRVYQRNMVAGAAPIRPRVAEITPEQVPPPYARLKMSEPARKVAFQDQLALGGQEDGVWSNGVQLVSRREPLSAGLNHSEQFMQFEATHRYFDENNHSFHRTDFFGRVRRSGGPTLGLIESIDYQPVWTSLNFKLDAGAYIQRPDGGLTVGDSEWSAFVKGAVGQKRDISPKSWHMPKLVFLVRDFSLNSTGNYLPEKIDQDVFTTYKYEHRQAMEVGDSIYHQPWLDTIWFGGVNAVSTEKMEMSPPDYLSLRAGWKQLFGRRQINATYQYTRFYANEQRPAPIEQHSVILDTTLSTWDKRQHRFETGAQLRYDSDTHAYTGMLFFTWHNGNGRGYRDFSGNELDFKDLNTRNIPVKPNNVVKDLSNE